MPSNWTIFRALCRVIGGQDGNALQNCLAANFMPRLLTMAASQDVLPTLAVRCFEQQEAADAIGNTQIQYLRDALLTNTRRNMHIVVQSIKLVQALNSAGITPLLLKGTAQLLTINRESPGFRKQADIDLIVKPASLLAAADALQAQGYSFYLDDQAVDGPRKFSGNTHAALTISAAHHHLPPLVKPDQAACVELHRHYLPRRFQHKNSLATLFDTATEHEMHGATFLVASTEQQIIHTVLGKLVHDGYLARRQFPIREAVDYSRLLDSVQGAFDRTLVVKQCGNAFDIFSQLVTELMGYQPAPQSNTTASVKKRIRIMQMRYDFPASATFLDGYARAEHLTYSLLHNPSKLTAYLRR